MTTKSSVQSLRGPQWGLVSLSIPLMAGMLFVEHRLKLSTFWHQFFGVAMILLVYGSMGVWLWLNSDYFASESPEFSNEPISFVLVEESESIEVYTLVEDGRIIEVEEGNDSHARPPDLPDDENCGFDMSAMIDEIEAELQAEYTKLHHHRV